ncbi:MULTISPECIES: hypothetical protein [Pseudescherichia]|jgi:hypothetical protein|uniref:hypothetical protein n=1 Tax=Pseudescherichia TaxID=2055880 RepID=UPI00214FB488|nr:MULTISPECIES: hypothetical protein [unclassified Pseudescherichia]MCR4459430.1 hypothetical protein [Pseudescherichia sp. L3]MDF2777803.1 hypothetical protein [Enterobacteriaceae bacterium]WPO95332.1 hypothetical protein SFA32_20755 [Buttiauxella sp. HR94]
MNKKDDCSSPFSETAKSQYNRHEIGRDQFRTATALAEGEVIERFGSAGAEYLKGYRGVNNETGQKMAKGLADVAKHKVNPDYAAQNIKQQAGFSAEIATTSRDNAEAIINRTPARTVRSDDLPEYGRNHNVVDRVQILDGTIIEGSQSQMKFVTDRDGLFSDIAKDDGKFARYRGVKLELPSEQYEGAATFCRNKATMLREQANKVEAQGKTEVAAKLRHEAGNYDQLADNVCDSGLTTEQAIYYREHPKLATAMDIARTSHRAGLEGAKSGAAVGGTISLVVNLFNVAQQKKELGEAIQDVAIDTAKAAALGYGTAFAGSAIKAGLQQSESQLLRAVSSTTAPALAVNICLSLGISIKRYVNNEIDEAELLAEVGEKGAGMLSSGMMAALGQIVIPVPVVGAAIGGMIGYTLSSMFYQSALEAARGAALSRERLARISAIEIEARAQIAKEKALLDDFTRREMPQLRQDTECFFKAMSHGSDNIDDLVFAINDFATLLGKKLQFQTMSEFEDFMDSDKPLIL